MWKKQRSNIKKQIIRLSFYALLAFVCLSRIDSLFFSLFEFAF